MKTIYVRKGSEYHAIIECIYKENLFLADIYRRARDCTEEIVQINAQLFQRENDGLHKDPCMDSIASGYADARGGTDIERLVSNRFNNIIAFCAERGQGKTSAMLSYAAALANLYAKSGQKLKDQKEIFWGGCTARNAYYEVLRSIDPTGMEADDTILKIVLSQMFSKFQKMVESRNAMGRGYGNDKSWDQECLDLQQKFLDCFHLANLLKASEKKKAPTNMEDELEIIMETGGGVNLRIKLYQLIKNYLEFMANGFNASKYLVIAIDDTDLNVGRVYEILEDVRKYFQLPQVIVLLATNIIQLESAVEQHFFEEYERSLSYARGMVDVDRCHQISERYLEKILPGTRRLNLPNLNDAIKLQFADLRIVYLDGNEKDLLNDNYSEEMIQKAEDKSVSKKEKWGYQEQLLYYLHRKTGLLFLPPEQGLHALLPDNMRGLMHFLVFFSKLEDVWADYFTIEKYVFALGDEKPEKILEQLDQWRENLRKLEAYLLQSWSSSNLRTESRNILMELSSYSGQLMHQYLLQVLPAYYGQIQAEKTLETETPSAYQKQFLNECAKSGAYSFDLSGTSLFYSNDCYADVLTGLRVLGEFAQGSRERKFIYSIRLYYTIYLHTMLLEKLNHLVDQEDQKYYLTEFLGDGLSKESMNKNGTMPFSLCSFWVPRKQFFKIIDPSKWNTQQGNAKLGTWFRLLEQKEHRTMVQHIPWDEKDSEQQIWVFNPLYYLLAEVDNLTGYKKLEKDDFIREQYKDSLSAQKRMGLALAVLLNGDVQAVFLEELKTYNQSTEINEFILSDLIKMPYSKSRLREKWGHLERINRISYAFGEEKVVSIQELTGEMDIDLNSIGYFRCFDPFGRNVIKNILNKTKLAKAELFNEDAHSEKAQNAIKFQKEWNKLREELKRLKKVIGIELEGTNEVGLITHKIDEITAFPKGPEEKRDNPGPEGVQANQREDLEKIMETNEEKMNGLLKDVQSVLKCFYDHEPLRTLANDTPSANKGTDTSGQSDATSEKESKTASVDFEMIRGFLNQIIDVLEKAVCKEEKTGALTDEKPEEGAPQEEGHSDGSEE